MRVTPALQAFIENFVGGGFNVTIDTVTLGAVPVMVLPNNFERMSAAIINTGTDNVAVAPNKQVSNTNGVLLGSRGGNLSLIAQEDLALVGWDWWGYASSGAPTVTVIQITRIYDARTQEGA